MQRLIRNSVLLLAMLGLVPGSFSQALARDVVTEVEPNDPCSQAQDIGAFSVPLIVDGSLDTPPTVPDVDFYRFSTAAPGTPLVADLEGQATGKGTLGDPFLGLYNSSCELLEYNDDFNSLNSRLQFNVPVTVCLS